MLTVEVFILIFNNCLEVIGYQYIGEDIYIITAGHPIGYRPAVIQ